MNHDFFQLNTDILVVILIADIPITEAVFLSSLS